MASLKRLLSYFARYRTKLVLGMLCLLIANLLKAAVPILLQRAVDVLGQEITYSLVARYSIAVFAIAVLQGGFIFVQEQLLLGTARCVERDMKSDFYGHMQKLSLEFFQQNRTGELMARTTNDMSTAVNASTEAFMYSANTVVALLIIVPLLVRLSWRLTVFALAPLLLVTLATLILQNRMRARFQKVQESFGEISARVQEALWAVRTIRAYTREQAEVENFRQVSLQSVRHNLRHTRLSGALYPLLQFFIGLSFIAVLWYGGELTASGKLSLGEFLEFILYLGYLAWPMYVLGWEMTVIQKGMVSMSRIESILALQPAIQDFPAPLVMHAIQGVLEFRNVTFYYQGAGGPALSEISFRINPGQTVGLVGAIGAGKSTLLNMIPRFLEPRSGEILMDGCPLRHIPLKTLRSSIGYVPQETFLFSDTIAANIAFGHDEATEKEISQAAINSGIGSDITGFAQGYKTMVGERGVTLSGGQKQRINIARAILLRPSILLLDDAFSSVDLHTEKYILGRLRKVMKGKTCVIASHRISTLKDADMILVLREGRIIEQGSHDELLARQGAYAEMHLAQLLEEDLAISPHPVQRVECAENGHLGKAASESSIPKP
jgi:ATP-binding cassette, subfamily B, multidrug efflux pump